MLPALAPFNDAINMFWNVATNYFEQVNVFQEDMRTGNVLNNKIFCTQIKTMFQSVSWKLIARVFLSLWVGVDQVAIKATCWKS